MRPSGRRKDPFTLRLAQGRTGLEVIERSLGRACRATSSARTVYPSGCPPRHEEGILVFRIESLPDSHGFIGEGPIETDRGLIRDARFEIERLNLPLAAKIDIESHQFHSEPLLPIVGVNGKIKEFGFALHHAKTDKSQEGIFVSIPDPEGETAGGGTLDLLHEGLP